MPICGPNLSLCCSVVSIWGIVMLALMGLFYRLHSPALFEDIPFDEKEWEKQNFSMTYVHEQYDKTALNCFIAAGIYVVFFLFSFCQHKANSRANYEMR
ncbi:hypothetical protein ACF0H5_015373 [Mactra antiquata]